MSLYYLQVILPFVIGFYAGYVVSRYVFFELEKRGEL